MSCRALKNMQMKTGFERETSFNKVLVPMLKDSSHLLGMTLVF